MNRNGNETESFAGNFLASGKGRLFFEVPFRSMAAPRPAWRAKPVGRPLVRLNRWWLVGSVWCSSLTIRRVVTLKVIRFTLTMLLWVKAGNTKGSCQSQNHNGERHSK
jgi:hypothetical protein